jgi:hypothetical protein
MATQAKPTDKKPREIPDKLFFNSVFAIEDKLARKNTIAKTQNTRPRVPKNI